MEMEGLKWCEEKAPEQIGLAVIDCRRSACELQLLKPKSITFGCRFVWRSLSLSGHASALTLHN